MVRFSDLRSVQQRHRFVLKIAEQLQLIGEVVIQRKCGTDKAALTQGLDGFGEDLFFAEYDDLCIGGPVGQRNGTHVDDRQERVAEDNGAAAQDPQRRDGGAKL